MSLLVINSSSRVARGFIKGFAQSGQFSKINCADLYPNYKAVERYLSLQEETGFSDKLVDTKITGKNSLVEAIKGSDKVVFVTHDYYLNIPSKISMFENVVKIMNQSFPQKKVRAFYFRLSL